MRPPQRIDKAKFLTAVATNRTPAVVASRINHAQNHRFRGPKRPKDLTLCVHALILHGKNHNVK